MRLEGQGACLGQDRPCIWRHLGTLLCGALRADLSPQSQPLSQKCISFSAAISCLEGTKVWEVFSWSLGPAFLPRPLPAGSLKRGAVPQHFAQPFLGQFLKPECHPSNISFEVHASNFLAALSTFGVNLCFSFTSYAVFQACVLSM